ncbi:MAG: hypothetical protein ACI8RP_000584 [Urechidicola sp.]|jgi:hypothetical protein|tara:strand:- start:171 stop:632 length:462 start_codon:yes stop_codon:yes gene_type:complete
MKFTPRKINAFLLFKLPAAYFTGVRVTSISRSQSEVKVKFRWVNQNPFKSMFWAVQGMASELSTGILVMQKIAESGKKISMLVTRQKGEFYKKAVGKITFKCLDGEKVSEAIQKTISNGEGQVIQLISEGFNEQNEKVSSFEYEWSVRLKKIN